MAEIDWRIRGPSLTSCNCDVGCPCQFNSLPTHGNCRATMGVLVEEGHFGDVDLTGVKFGVLVGWPKAIHEGNGEAQPYIDPDTTPEQRAAILSIIAGEHSDPGSNIFNVFAATLVKIHEPIFAPIDIECDVDLRVGHIRIPDVLDMSCEPIRNPITGEAHRARIDIPNGFEYTVAEVAVGSTQTGAGAAVDLSWSGAHAHLIDLHWTQHGVVH